MDEQSHLDVRADAKLSAAGPMPSRPARRSWRPSRRFVLFALLPIALLVVAYVYVTGGQVMSTENAYVQADMLGVATDVSGVVKSIPVHENQVVRAGDVLFELDDLQFRIAVARATAMLETARDDIEALKSSYQDMQAQIQQAQSDIV